MNDAERLIRSALDQRPADLNDAHTVVFTQMPDLWGGHARSLEVIDIPRFQSADSALKQKIVEQFIAAGWSADSIVLHYRTGIKAIVEFDLVLFNRGQPVLAVDVRPHTEPSNVTSFRNAPLGIPFLCETDGARYVVWERERSRALVGEAAPSPGDLGIAPEYSPLLESASLTLDEDVLRSALRPGREISVIIDSTIPFGARIADGSRLAWLRDYLDDARLPEAFEEGAHSKALTLQDALLAVCAQSASVKSISALVPEALLSASRYAWLRKRLLQRMGLAAIVQLPQMPGAFGASISLSLLYLAVKAGPTFFHRVDTVADLSVDPQAVLALIRSGLDKAKASTSSTVDVEPDKLWTVAAHDPALRAERERLARLGELVPLRDLVSIVRSRGAAGSSETTSKSQKAPLIRGDSITPTGLDVSEAEAIIIPPEGAGVVTNGDVVSKSVFRVGGGHIAAACNVPAGVLSPSVFGLRMTDERLTQTFLVEYLNSATARAFLESRASSLAQHARISARDLGDLLVPIGIADLFGNLATAIETEVALRTKADEISALRGTIFESTSHEECEGKAAAISRVSAIYSKSIAAASEPVFRIANFYPYPVAFGYRLLSSIAKPVELYKEQLRVSENILAFLACVSLALIERSDRGRLNVDLIRVWEGGASPGHWREIIKATAEVFRDYEHPLCKSLARLKINEISRGFGKDAESLIKSKNDFTHDRGPATEGDFEEAARELGTLISRTMGALDFMMDYPIRRVVDFDFPRGRSAATVTCNVLLGDHPGLPQEVVELPRDVLLSMGLTKGDLYLDLGSDRWICLYPFLQMLTCASCKAHETYFIDKVDWKRERPLMKSFERGHTEDAKAAVAQEVKAWRDPAGAPRSAEPR